VQIRLIVIHEGERANALLIAVAHRLGLSGLTPDEHGDVYIRLEAAAGETWQRVRDALDAAGEDWWEHIYLPRHDIATAASPET
jgi:hypothetical protein